MKKQINIDGKRILKSKEVLNRLEVNGENNIFITLKDRKENSSNNSTLNHKNGKKRIGTYQQAILDTANKNIRKNLLKNP